MPGKHTQCAIRAARAPRERPLFLSEGTAGPGRTESVDRPAQVDPKRSFIDAPSRDLREGQFLRNPSDARDISPGDGLIMITKFALRFVKPN